MNELDLKTKIEGLEKAIQEHKADTSRYEDQLKEAEQQLKDYNKIALPPVVFDDIYEAIEKGVDQFDFSDTDNFDKEFGLEYDGKVYLESLELCNHQDLVEMIVDKVSRLFKEADAPEDEPTAEEITK